MSNENLSILGTVIVGCCVTKLDVKPRVRVRATLAEPTPQRVLGEPFDMSLINWGDLANGVERNGVTPPPRNTLMFAIWHQIIKAFANGKTSIVYTEKRFGSYMPVSSARKIVVNEAKLVAKWLGVKYD